MKTHLGKAVYALVILTMLTPVLVACGTPEALPAATEAPTAAPTQAPSEEPTPLPEPAPATGPAIGGTLVWAMAEEAGTLDPHLESRTASSQIEIYFGAALIALAGDGSFLPWLAESWDISEDGLTWDFKLREDVLFHDGTPLTAQDYAWTFSRALDPDTGSTGAGTLLGGVVSAAAVDDYTLRLTLESASFPLLVNLATIAWVQPMPQASFEELGDDFGRQPIGTGPFKFKEWITGDRIVLERNPDYDWGPAFVHGGAPYIENLEFRIIPEYSTIIAGLEAGEIDLADVQPKDVQRIKDTGMFRFIEGMYQGSGYFLAMNTSKPPFDDIRVRQAFNMAVDKDVLVQTVALGAGVPLYGPLTPSTMGYWSGVEDLGYQYDLDGAKDLLAEAGYELGSDGILQKDGEPLKLTLNVSSNFEDRVKIAQILQEQYRALGVDIEIEQLEHTMIIEQVWPGNYEIALMMMEYPEFDLMGYMFSSAMIGALNMSMWSDPELDDLLTASKTTMDPAARQEIANQVQQYLVENAVTAPLYAAKTYTAFSTRFSEPLFNQNNQDVIWLDDAYLVE
ncbi:MAG TPA: ABC transporter substrate-binding protein [Anaerolineae bacterium]|nr:ABC transporter substrate-binding protein [Anaerolineae bacterium]